MGEDIMWELQHVDSTLPAYSFFPNENANLPSRIFSVSVCDTTWNGSDVSKAAEEMWDKYQIHHRQVDRCDLVKNNLSNSSGREHISHDRDSRAASF